jgi:hypothetical protein
VNELQIKLQQKSKDKSKEGHVYIACNQKEADRNIYKIGFTSNLKDRKKGLNTSECDDAFIFRREYKTKNAKLAEKICHDILDDVDRKYNREFYNCSLDLIIRVVETVTHFVNAFDDLEDITAWDNLKIKITGRLPEVPMITNNHNENNDSHDTNNTNNVTINVNVHTSEPKFLSTAEYERFATEVLQKDTTGMIWTSELLNAINEWLQRCKLTPKAPILGGSVNSFGFQQAFKEEVVDAIQRIFNTKEMRLEKSREGTKRTRSTGMRGIRVCRQQV